MESEMDLVLQAVHAYSVQWWGWGVEHTWEQQLLLRYEAKQQQSAHDTSLYHNLWKQVLKPIWDRNVKPVPETRGIPLQCFMRSVWAYIVRIGLCQQPLFPQVGRYIHCAGQAQLLWTLLLQVPWHTQAPMCALWCSCLVYTALAA